MIVTHGVGINAASVADNALCLLLAVVRNPVPAITYVREGGWPEKGRPPATPTITGKRLGILGLGAIGHEIARRTAGLNTRTANREPPKARSTPGRRSIWTWSIPRRTKFP